jgi:pimeloyl-ACP methyl ester carboxylesterase
MTEIAHRTLDVGNVRLHIAEAGTGPLVLLLHGFPECWYSWRHQLTALAAAGYHAVAPDQRGYARSDAPADVDAYTILHLVGDAVGLIGALGADRAVVAGHDWGAPVAWHTALLRPDLVRGVIGLSVPHRPRTSRPPLRRMRERFGDGFYMAYFQTPGIADAELGRDPRATFRRMLYAGSGDGPGLAPIVPDGGGFLDVCPDQATLPRWLSAADLDTYAAEFTSGFTGGLNWYRNLDRNWELTAAWHRAPVLPPALFVTGDRDLATGDIDPMRAVVPDFRILRLPGIGHWTQQEAPGDVTTAMIEFLTSL